MTLVPRLALAGVALALCGSATAARFVPPPWLIRSERSVLARDFQHATPTRITYIAYPKKIAVIFEFRRRVVCGPCGRLPGRPPLAARVIRVSFDRQTHALAGAKDGFAIELCEAAGDQPPKSRCLHH